MSQTSESTVKKVLQPLGCCLGCAGLLVGIPILLAITAYGVVFHTSIPLRFVLNIAEAESNMQFKGVRGSVTTGFTIKEWIIKGQNGAADSQVENLTFRYNGIVDAIQNQRLIIDEISVAKADLVVRPDVITAADSITEDDTSASDDSTDEIPDNNPDASTPADESVEWDFEFQLKTLDLQNVRIRSSDDQFELAIPHVTLDEMQFNDQVFSLKLLDIQDFQLQLPDVGAASTAENPDAVDLAIPQVRLAGLEITGDRFNLAELDVTSNFVNLSLEEAQPQTINGEVIPYSRRLRGQVSPTVNEVILRSFDFTLDVATTDHQIIHRFIGFSGAVEQVSFPSGGSFTRTKGFSPGDYFALPSDLVPERCSLLSISKPVLVESATESTPATITSTIQGDCYWGATQFTLAPQSGETLAAKAQVPNHTITLSLTDNNASWLPMLEFTANPPLPLVDILALVYFRKRYDQLNVGERSRIDTMATELQDIPPS